MKADTHAPRSESSHDIREAAFYAELLDKAHTEGLKSIRTQLLAQPAEENGQRCIAKAVVETAKGTFEGIGDADPTNVEGFLAPHLIRVAETRAKARALRDAVNCGVVSFEEQDGSSRDRTSSPGPGATRTRASRPGWNAPPARPRNGGGNGQDGKMSEAQRRYLFRLLAGMGHQGKAAEDYLYAELDVHSLASVTRLQASELIDRLLQTSAPGNGGGNGSAARDQH
jgi:hypothetical protein